MVGAPQTEPRPTCRAGRSASSAPAPRPHRPRAKPSKAAPLRTHRLPGARCRRGAAGAPRGRNIPAQLAPPPRPCPRVAHSAQESQAARITRKRRRKRSEDATSSGDSIRVPGKRNASAVRRGRVSPGKQSPAAHARGGERNPLKRELPISAADETERATLEATGAHAAGTLSRQRWCPPWAPASR